MSTQGFLYSIHTCSVVESCLILCDPKDCSPTGSSVHGLLQARILEWAAIPFSRGSSWPRDQSLVSCIGGRFFTVWATRDACKADPQQIFFNCIDEDFRLIDPWKNHLSIFYYNAIWEYQWNIVGLSPNGSNYKHSESIPFAMSKPSELYRTLKEKKKKSIFIRSLQDCYYNPL